IVNPLAAILISAPTGRHQFPQVLKTFDWLKIHRMITPGQIMKLAPLADLFMGFKNKEQRTLFYDMLQSNGPEFLHFSVNSVLGWRNTEPPSCKYVQILGTGDKLFKQSKIKDALLIEGSGHFTAFEKGQEVSEMINKYIRENIIP